MEGGSSLFLEEAEGRAARDWLMVHGGDWRSRLGLPSSVFGGEEEDVVIKKVAKEVHTTIKEVTTKVVEHEVRGSGKSGLAALDAMSKEEAHMAAPKTINQLFDNFKKTEEEPRRSRRKVEQMGLMKTIGLCSSTSSIEEDMTPKRVKRQESESPRKKKFKSGSAEEEDQKRKKAGKDEDEENKLSRSKSLESQWGVGLKMSPQKKSRIVFGKFSEEDEEEETVAFSFNKSPAKSKSILKQQEKVSVQKSLIKKSKMFSEIHESSSKSNKKSIEHTSTNEKNVNVSKQSQANVALKETIVEKVFKFSAEDKKEKEKRAKKANSNSVKKSFTEKAKTPPPEATGSSVFDHDDDPLIAEITRKQEKEARALARRSRTRGCKTASMAKMAEYQLEQSQQVEDEETSKKTRRKKREEKKKPDDDKAQPKIAGFFNKNKKTGAKASTSKNCELDYSYTPDIDELLRLPERPEDGSKTQDEILDDLEAEIARRQLVHEEEMARVDLEIEGERRKREERRARQEENSLLRTRLQTDLTEDKLRKLFTENLAYLQGVQGGEVTSARHQAFHKSVRTRQALYHTLITDPFSDQQLTWTLEEISKVWMRNKREQMDNNEYVWKVLLPECFIKLYMDWFKVEKTEAELMIMETPIDERIEDGGE